MRCLSILVTLFCLCINANADTKSEKVAELVEAKGLLDGWAAQIERNQEYFGVQEQTIVDQTLSRLNPNEEFSQIFLGYPGVQGGDGCTLDGRIYGGDLFIVLRTTFF